jgi:elongation factor Ts
MISAAMVKELRERTGAGMMDCKKALTETNGDMEAAIDYLREKGLSQAAKKSGRVAAEGLVAIGFSADGKQGAIIEVNSETDFVAKNAEFVDMVNAFVQVILDNNFTTVEELLGGKLGNGTVQDELTAKIAKIGENMTIRRFAKYDAEGSVCAGYIHGGKIGVLVDLQTAASDVDTVKSMGRDVAMQVASMNPQFVDEGDVDPDYLEREKKVLLQQALNENAESAKPKPAEIVEKMVAGRLKKELKETCLLQQPFVKDGNISISEYVKQITKAVGADVTVKRFVRYEVGEGIEKKVDDLAAEVAKLTK